MELKTNMYVRTEHGIYKINGYINNNYTQKFTYIDNLGVSNFLDKNQVIKASFNIIDLIEVGDYVNGYKVRGTSVSTLLLDNFNMIKIEDYEIKSIVTKEQMESMKYEVE